MYGKHETSLLREAFWTAFGQYMALHLSAEGEKINWVNYKTGVKHVSFKTYADRSHAAIRIEITHPDEATRRKYFEQFLQSKKLLRQFLHEDWNWEPAVADDNGRTISRISIERSSVNIYTKEDWPAIISFLKPRLLSLDAFWNLARYGFENL
jgi:hypothetical protein